MNEILVQDIDRTITNPPEGAEPIATLRGQLDIAEHEGRPVFLVKDDAGVGVRTFIEQDGRPRVPPSGATDLFKLPSGATDLCTLPNASNVLGHIRAMNVTGFAEFGRSLYCEIVDHLKACVEISGEGYYHALAAFTMLSYVIEAVDRLPHILLFGQTGSGKTECGLAVMSLIRLGKAIASVSTAALRVLTNCYGAALFIDTTDINAVFRGEAKDVLLAMYRRCGDVLRVLSRKASGESQLLCDKVFAPLVIASNVRPDDTIGSRSITIVASRSRRVFTNDAARWNTARNLRERLTAFRIYMYGRPLPDSERPTHGRNGDLFHPLLQVVTLVCPPAAEHIIDLTVDTAHETAFVRSMTVEGTVLRAIVSVFEETRSEVIALTGVRNAYMSIREGLPLLSSEKIGHIARSFGLQQAGRTRDGARYRIDPDKLALWRTDYALEPTPTSTPALDMVSLVATGVSVDAGGGDGSAPPMTGQPPVGAGVLECAGHGVAHSAA